MGPLKDVAERLDFLFSKTPDQPSIALFSAGGRFSCTVDSCDWLWWCWWSLATLIKWLWRQLPTVLIVRPCPVQGHSLSLYLSKPITTLKTPTTSICVDNIVIIIIVWPDLSLVVCPSSWVSSTLASQPASTINCWIRISLLLRSVVIESGA